MGPAGRGGGGGGLAMGRRLLAPATLAGAATLVAAAYAPVGTRPRVAAAASVSSGSAGAWPDGRGSARSVVRALCASSSRPDRLRARRSLLPAAAPPGSVPAGTVTVTVTRAALVGSLARELCHLPTSLAGATACPMFVGPDYTLWFSVRRLTFPPVTAETGGCEPVTGLGPTRWAIRSPLLWRLAAEVFRVARVHPQPLDEVALSAATPSGRALPVAPPTAAGRR
ncbi:MAG TPA: hypothetical protein VMU75_02925 [Acidimicrobiales bacterium]|nr:hypothetical protein [Acidimicrobiales bacterium]